MRLGMIGTGSMGRMLIHAFVTAQSSEAIYACNRSTGKLKQIVADYPTVVPMSTPIELVHASDVIFVCVKPGDAADVIHMIAPYVRADQFVVSILSALSVADLEMSIPSRVVKILPSITQQALSGTCLVMPGTRLTIGDTGEIMDLLSTIGLPHVISEDKVRISADLTSCGPAFLAFLLKEISLAGARQGDIPLRESVDLVTSMVIGTARLLESGVSLEEVIERVSVPGGITSAGIEVLRASTAGIFDHLFATTRAKGDAHRVHTKPPDDGNG